MNREIKFRAFHTKLQKMFTPEEMESDQLTLTTTGQFINVSGVSTKLSEIIDCMIPLQYTGLKDKNGIAIYEGDIIKHGESIRFIEYRWSNFTATRPSKTETILLSFCEKPEVIGNIYQNPELIARETDLRNIACTE